MIDKTRIKKYSETTRFTKNYKEIVESHDHARRKGRRRIEEYEEDINAV